MKRINTLFICLSAALLASACTKPESPVSPRFNHVYLTMTDLERSIDFYTQAFDVEVTNRITELKRTESDGTVSTIKVNMAFLKFPGHDFVFEIGERPEIEVDNTKASYAHLGIDVTDITAAAKRLDAAGATLLSPVALVEARGVSAKNTFFQGPDGEIIELMEMIAGEF